ncbi:clavesin-1-like [Ostrinia furnacalis]|uniref:clavesin-1-like n=1 Tax=Ostrinia furnacalis TaxID=93504 RepID=UPI00103DBB6D|nr:clavesin-1-like [Ostrinia furnacalis]
MTTASVLLTVSTTWNLNSEKIDKGKVGRSPQSIAAETAKELRETPATREQGLKIMREWIQQNCDIKNVRQDDSFLLRFLRHKKYSIPMAQQTLLKYLNLRKYYPEIFMNLDCEDSKLQDIINNGYVVVSPVRDSKGRRVIVYNMSRFNASQLTCWDMCRVHTMIYESLLEDPLDQICGFTHVGDGSGVSGAHVTAWNPTDFARLMKWGEFFFFSQTHSTLKQLHKNIDVACLPTVYGGEIPLQEMISFTKQILSDQRKKVCHLTEMEILSTRGITSSKVKNKPDQISVEGSFRKLEID